MSQILPPLWAQLQKYYSIQQPHSSWHLSTSYSFYTVTLHLMKYYRQIFLSDRSVSVSTKLLYNDSADSSFKLQEGWYLNYCIYFVTVNNYSRMKVEFHLFYPWMSVMYLMCWFLTIENKVCPGWPASCRCSFVLTNLIPLIGSLPTELTFGFWGFALNLFIIREKTQDQLSSCASSSFTMQILNQWNVTSC